MTNDTRTPDQIERDIVTERAEMSDTFRDLQEKFSVETIFNDISDMVRDQRGEIGRRVSHTVGRNPAAVAVIGVGLAWLLLGKDRSEAVNGEGRRSRQSSSRRDAHGWSSGGHASERDPSWYGNTHASPDRRAQGRGLGHDGPSEGEAEGSGGMLGRVRDAADTAGHAISDAAGNWRDKTSDLTARLSHGLEDLSEEARSRVISARRAAHDARVSSEAMMHRGMRGASNLFEDQPLVVGALAVAAGAAIGAMLPHTQLEDDTMGESSDRLFAEAEAVFREERDRAMATARKVGKTVASEVRSDLKDMGSTLGDLLPEGKSASDVMVDHASNAAGRVRDSATGTSGQRDTSRSKT
ncbi:DUF3618 domain-containing protein [Roseicyclus mahoneyensis]|uniref:Uncharacterized protein DUF3618 n=1 Tax=Roseicyclus mahoneyensis TaxID=164332 RepID=A0A316GKV9_9RHOB|nr:DUF3618 domain-containing protein [Roseicyclus mahoneyensis]PWK61462.1 uncharacterized protein DUF3618 [Roseicyclus mahoneyensis]